MKFKRVLHIFLTFIAVISLILSFGPLLLTDYNRSEMMASPQDSGAFFYYQFNSQFAFVSNKQLSNTSIPMSSCGIMELEIQGSNANIHVVDQLSAAGIVSYVQNSRYIIPLSSSFVEVLLNNAELNKGSVVAINAQLAGDVLGQSRYPTSLNYQGGNSTLQTYASKIGVISPTSVSLINFNTSGVPSLYLRPGTMRSPNEIEYGDTDGTNVLLEMRNSGNSGFLDQMYRSYNTSLVKVYGFFISLIGSNVAISPLAYAHYLELFLPIEILAWIVGAAYILILYRRIKMKNKPKVLERRREAHE